MAPSAARVKQELAWRKAKTDVLWATKQWWIQHPQGSRAWAIYPAQEEILLLWASGAHALHLKARQLGFSTSVAFFAWWRAYFNEDVKVLLLSRGERESTELLSKLVYGLDRLPKWLKDRGPEVTSKTQSKITFSNGSEIVSLPSANNPARGFTGALTVVDEWAFLPNGEEAWAAIEPTADIGGQVIGLSTANGEGNMFHTLWVKAQGGDSMFVPKFYPWSAVPGRDEEWYSRKQKNMLSWALHQEYPTDAEEAFIRSGATVFDVTTVKSLEIVQPARYVMEFAGTSDVRLVHNDEGPVYIWHMPEHNRAYVMGVDTAEGLSHGDYSSVHVMDVQNREIVAAWHGHIPADLLADQVHGLGTLYNGALCGVEANNHGLTTITGLRRLRYPRIWRRRSTNSVNNKIGVEFGFKTTSSSKPPLIDALGGHLRALADQAKPLNDPGLRSELLTYVRRDNGRMGGSPHDDRVMSAALAVKMLDYAHQPEYKQKIDDKYTGAWWGRLEHHVEPEVTGIRPLSTYR